MTIVDFVVIALLIGAAWSGLRQGLITALLALIGAVAGAIAAIRLAPLVMVHISDSAARTAVGIAFVIVGVGVGEWVGSSLGRSIARRITWRPAVAVDKGLGLVGYAIAVLVVTWMIAVPLSTAPLPWLSSAINHSVVLGKVNSVMPTSVQDLSRRLRQVFNDSGFPAVLDPLSPTPVTDVPTPDPALTSNPAIRAAAPSIVKVRSLAASCSRQMEGSGFVVAPGRVLTNAHVVAGSNRAVVDLRGGELQATVVHYDPQRDIAVLAVPGLDRPALHFASHPLITGDDAVVAGYPLDGPFTVTPARVRSQILLKGPNIYDSKTVIRDVYTLRTQVRPGNSGGPLLTTDGQVAGVVFGVSLDNPDVGFALTAQEVAPAVANAAADHQPVETGACTAG